MLFIFSIETNSVWKSYIKYIDKVFQYKNKKFKDNKKNIVRYIFLCSKSRFDTKNKEISNLIKNIIQTILKNQTKLFFALIPTQTMKANF